MLKVTVKSLLARRFRLVTSGLAVLLGVAFMAGALVLTDTIGRTFSDLFAGVNAGTDAYVRSTGALGGGGFDGQRARVDVALVDAVAAVDGVEAAEGTIEDGYAQLLDRDGEPLGGGFGPPTFGSAWGEVDELNAFSLVEGVAPSGPGEVVIDEGSAEDAGLDVGDRTRVLVQAGSEPVEVVGIARLGNGSDVTGASYVLFAATEAQRLVAEPGRVDAIRVVATPGVTQGELARRVAEALPGLVEVLTGAEITEEEQSALAEGLGFLSRFLLVFAGIALFVGAFIIHNTFSILVAQRAREMALYRAVGASRTQVLSSVVLEAVVVGLLASGLGLLLGIGVAGALKSLLGTIGLELPGGGVVLTGGTVVAALVTGVAVSLVAAVLPARRASKVAPVAAMRDEVHDVSNQSRVRALAGLALLALGGALLWQGLGGDVEDPVQLVGGGVLATFVGVVVLGPSVAPPLSRAIGWPLPRLRGMAGNLARENAARNPRRTASTAAALMIGVGLVGFIAIVAASATASIDEVIDDTVRSDFVLNAETFGFGGLSPDLAAALDRAPEVDEASGVRFGFAEVAGDTQQLLAVDPATFGVLVDVGVTDGSLGALDTDGVAVQSDVAAESGLAVGDTIGVRFAETGLQRLEVAALFTEGGITGDYLLGLPAYEANVADQFDSLVYVTVADGVATADARAAVEEVAADHPTAEVQDLTEFKEAQSALFRPLLGLIYVLLALAVLIALVGIANTLALSIFERTHELGLLRAVGMTRGQLRSTVRWESVIIALLGTVLGLALGISFGWAMVAALADDGFTELRVPFATIAVVTTLAALAGVVAAVLPARRAGRLDVLGAIAHV